MTSQQSIDVYRFREIARSLFDGLNLSDNEILGRIEENRKDLYDYCLLINELEVLLGLKANFGITESKIELIINRVKEMGETIPRSDPQENLEVCEIDINEMREKEFDMLLEKVSKLESDLRIANKVIARLVGE
jgi:hypothetical protein